MDADGKVTWGREGWLQMNVDGVWRYLGNDCDVASFQSPLMIVACRQLGYEATADSSLITSAGPDDSYPHAATPDDDTDEGPHETFTLVQCRGDETDLTHCARGGHYASNDEEGCVMNGDGGAHGIFLTCLEVCSSKTTVSDCLDGRYDGVGRCAWSNNRCEDKYRFGEVAGQACPAGYKPLEDERDNDWYQVDLCEKAARDLDIDFWGTTNTEVAPHGCYQPIMGYDGYDGTLAYNYNEKDRIDDAIADRKLCVKAVCNANRDCGEYSVCNGGVCQASCDKHTCPPGQYNTGIVGGEFDLSTCCRACVDVNAHCREWADNGACPASWMQAQCGVSCGMCPIGREPNDNCGQKVGATLWSPNECRLKCHKNGCSRNCHKLCNDSCKCNMDDPTGGSCKDDRAWRAERPKKHKGKKCIDLGMQACKSVTGKSGGARVSAKRACRKTCGQCRRLSVV